MRIEIGAQRGNELEMRGLSIDIGEVLLRGKLH
jgi:hypothetical protein